MLINRYSSPRHALEGLKFYWGNLAGNLKGVAPPVDVMFLFCDHFEGRALTLTREEVEVWAERYPKVALRHRDSDGHPPRHTWFYLYSDEADNASLLRTLSSVCATGCGEVELHLHHGRGYFEGRPVHNAFADVETSAGLQVLLRQALEDFCRAGVRRVTGKQPRTSYAVIHGAWALDNSRWMPGYHGWCGVNDELDVLKATGCYADFTFPAWGTMQPAKINSLYYAHDDPTRPKSYNTGVDLAVLRPGQDALVIFQGPVLGGSDISRLNHPSPRRAASWIRSGVHVKGRPNWIFVKVHTHGCQDLETMNLLLGDQIDAFFSHLEETYGDGDSFRLHYVTAREAFNIAKAAEAGMDGDPGQFRDFLIPPYQARGTVIHELELRAEEVGKT
jgi:hypothetical protein